MTRILFDTNILLDVLFERDPHLVVSAQLWDAIEKRLADGLVAAHAVTTIHYALSKSGGGQLAARSLLRMLRIFEVATVDDIIIRAAVTAVSGAVPGDFEDAVTAAAAEAARCNLIVTRDPKGFRRSPVLAIGPEEALRLISG